MPRRETARTDKLKPHGFKEPAAAPDNVGLLASREFEVISWLTAIGVLISVLLVATYPAFDPAAALLGQVP